MDDLISRQAAIDAIEGITSSMSICVNSDECHGMKRMQRQAVLEIANLPAIQPKRGRRIYGEDEYGIDGYHCDKCGFFVPWDYTHTFINYITDYNFCPSCGAEMSEGGKDALN